MPQGNRTSFLVQKLTGRNLKPGGFKQASSDRNAKQNSARHFQGNDLSAKVDLKLLVSPIENFVSVCKESQLFVGLKSDEELENFLGLHPAVSVPEISNEAEDDEDEEDDEAEEDEEDDEAELDDEDEDDEDDEEDEDGSGGEGDSEELDDEDEEDEDKG